MPASATTTSLPRPRTRSGMPRGAGERGPGRPARPRPWPSASRSAGPPTRIVVWPASGSSRRGGPRSDASLGGGRRASPGRSPAAGAASSRGRRGARRRGAAAPAAVITAPLPERPPRSGPRPGRAASRRPPGPAPPPRPRRRAGPATGRPPPSRRAPSRSSRIAAAASSASASKSSSSTSRAAPAPDHLLGVAALVAGGVRVRHHDHRQAEGGDLGQRRGAGPADDQVGGGEGEGHLVVEEPLRPIAVAQLRRQGVATGDRLVVAGVAGDVDDAGPLDQPRQRLGHGRVEAPNRLRAAEDQQQPVRRPGCRAPSRGLGPADRPRVADRRAGDEARPPPSAEGAARALEGHGQAAGQSGRHADAPARAPRCRPTSRPGSAAPTRPAAPAGRRTRRS